MYIYIYIYIYENKKYTYTYIYTHTRTRILNVAFMHFLHDITRSSSTLLRSSRYRLDIRKTVVNILTVVKMIGNKHGSFVSFVYV
jgi:hypothetical protein